MGESELVNDYMIFSKSKVAKAVIKLKLRLNCAIKTLILLAMTRRLQVY